MEKGFRAIMTYCVERFPRNDIWIVSTMKYNYPKLLQVETWFDTEYQERGYEVHIVTTDPAIALHQGALIINDHKQNQWRKDFGQI